MDIHDVTPQALITVSQSGVRWGLPTAPVPASTATAATIERRPGVLKEPRQASSLALGAWQRIVDPERRPRRGRLVLPVLGE